jgi:hypothetical protein
MAMATSTREVMTTSAAAIARAILTAWLLSSLNPIDFGFAAAIDTASTFFMLFAFDAATTPAPVLRFEAAALLALDFSIFALLLSVAVSALNRVRSTPTAARTKSKRRERGTSLVFIVLCKFFYCTAGGRESFLRTPSSQSSPSTYVW